MYLTSYEEAREFLRHYWHTLTEYYMDAKIVCVKYIDEHGEEKEKTFNRQYLTRAIYDLELREDDGPDEL